MSLDIVRVKEEREGVLGESEAAVAELYVGHEVKEELVLGPEVLQPPDVSFMLGGPFREKDQGNPMNCAADAGGAPGPFHRAHTTDGALHEGHRIKQELTEGPPMVEIHSPSFFDDFAVKTIDIKPEPATESKRSTHPQKLQKLQEKHWPQHNIKPCHIPLMRVDEIKKTNADRTTKSLPDKKPKRFFCNYCGKGFSLKQSLQVHLRIHTGEKPFTCKVCRKKFSDMSILIRHRRIHTGEKPHTCDICHKQFSEKYLLRYHKRIHSGDTPYICTYCSKTYNHISNLKRHIRTHEKPFICEICNTHFNIQAKLETHLVTHLKRRPYSCDVCEKRFSIKGHLNRHVKIHLNVKDYCCAVCKAKFSQQASLKKHVGRNVCGKR